MVRRLVLIAVVLVLVVAAAQFVQPARTNPPTDERGTFATALGVASPVALVIDRSCGDCHSNKTDWNRYTKIVPVSWAVTAGVDEGRRAVNFSTWTTYSPEQRRALLRQSCEDASTGKMPPSVFMVLRPEARLTSADIATLCAAASAPR